MRSFPLSAPLADVSAESAAGADGGKFVECAPPGPEKRCEGFAGMVHALTARNKTNCIELRQQGDIIWNAQGSNTARVAAKRGPCAPAMAYSFVGAP